MSGPYRVRILDLSGGAEDNLVEEVGPFPDIETANAFARAYVRDSVERCREASGTTAEAEAVLEAWFAWGEDAEVVDADAGAGEDGWRSATELRSFAELPAGAEERDWRSLDPRGREEED